MSPEGDAEAPLVELGDDEVTAALREAQALLARYPVAAQALFRALVAEGRAYAQTPEGAALRDRLAGTDLIRRGRVVWEVGSLNMLEEKPERVLPSRVLDAFVKASAVQDLEPFLTRLFGLQGL